PEFLPASVSCACSPNRGTTGPKVDRDHFQKTVTASYLEKARGCMSSRPKVLRWLEVLGFMPKSSDMLRHVMRIIAFVSTNPELSQLERWNLQSRMRACLSTTLIT